MVYHHMMMVWNGANRFHYCLYSFFHHSSQFVKMWWVKPDITFFFLIRFEHCLLKTILRNHIVFNSRRLMLERYRVKRHQRYCDSRKVNTYNKTMSTFLWNVGMETRNKHFTIIVAFLQVKAFKKSITQNKIMRLSVFIILRRKILCIVNISYTHLHLPVFIPTLSVHYLMYSISSRIVSFP